MQLEKHLKKEHLTIKKTTTETQKTCILIQFTRKQKLNCLARSTQHAEPVTYTKQTVKDKKAKDLKCNSYQKKLLNFSKKHSVKEARRCSIVSTMPITLLRSKLPLCTYVHLGS